MSCPAPDPVVGLTLAVVLVALLAAHAVAVIVIMRRHRAGRDTTTGAAGVARSWRGASAAPQTRPVQGREAAGRAATSRPDSSPDLPPPFDQALLADLLGRAEDARRGITPARRWPRS